MNIDRAEFKLALAALLFASLACQTVMGPRGSSEAAQNIGQLKASATPTEMPPVSMRLSGEDLPDLIFGPPGESPNDRYRPDLSGEPQTLDTEHFRMHYSLDGRDRVPEANANSNDHPDYVEEVARAMEFSWYAQVDYFGWTAPPPDGELGGDERYDVYLEDILDEDIAGYTDWDYEEDEGIDNPNSERIEPYASTSFIALDNDYAENHTAIGETLDYMRVTAAHEFNHAIQFGYDAFEPHGWVWEATANWMQDEVFDSVNEGNDILPSVFNSPDTCQLDPGEEDADDSDHWYGEWIFIRYLSERYGHNAVKELWELSIQADRYKPWDELLERQGTSFDLFFRDFSVALLTRDFQEGIDYPVISLEGEVEFGETYTPVDGVGQVAADYLEINAAGIVAVLLSGEDMEGVVVGIREQESYLFPLVEGEAVFATDAFDHSYLIVMNLQRAMGEANCQLSDYTVSIHEADDPENSGAVVPAPNFEAPRVDH